MKRLSEQHGALTPGQFSGAQWALLKFQVLYVYYMRRGRHVEYARMYIQCRLKYGAPPQ
jgi:hypothetical protein